ncbi:peptidoglycan-binding domain-containing protein [Sorangium sp. So ce513]|uniref:peptidoglycan-binding domain-containing protein n=1 Tax=Sorangium sp. So ce513 TaxID=3133315 RepID=UPI003F5DCECC
MVRQGEYLSLLAVRHGFSADNVWSAPENAGLRQRRASPDVLAPGDILYLPDRAAAGARLHARAQNSYRASVPRVPVCVTLHTEDGPLANARCVVHTGASPLEIRTNGEGMLRFDAPMNAHEVRIDVPDEELTLRVLVGFLDPPDDGSGAFDRLVNLGLLSPVDRHAPESQRRARVREALAAFQERRGLEPTGELDEPTRCALRDEHGV